MFRRFRWWRNLADKDVDFHRAPFGRIVGRRAAGGFKKLKTEFIRSRDSAMFAASLPSRDANP